MRLTISTTSSLQPNAAVELTIEGVAREAIDGGEVVLALPTRAIMDYKASDTGVPEVPAKARWDLSAIAKGGTWSETFTVPGEAAGYYGVMVNAYTHGPDGGPWLFDDVSRSAWMFVSETDGQLTRLFEESLGPAASDDTLYSRSDPTRTTPNWHRDSAYRSGCGRLKTIQVEPHWYVPWRHLNVGGERVSEHFWHYRENPVDLQLHRGLLQHPPPPLGARLPVAGELRETQPCGLTRTCSFRGGRSSPGFSHSLASSASLVTPL